MEWILSVSAVGSLKERYEPQHVVVPDQFIDRTRGRQAESTFFGRGVVAHVQFADPFCTPLSRVLADSRHQEDLIDAWQGFGDWLAPDALPGGDGRSGATPKDLIGTAFFCYSAKLLARIAGVLGNLSDLERYEELAQRARAAFRRRFVTGDGRLVGETQTGYVLALHFGLLELFESIASPWLQFCFDTGHANMSRNSEALLHELAPYLRHVHLADNGGEHDDHLPFRRGTVQWDHSRTWGRFPPIRQS